MSWGQIVGAVIKVGGSYLASKQGEDSGGTANPSAPFVMDKSRYSPQNKDGYVVSNKDYVSTYNRDTQKRASDQFSGNGMYFPGMFGGNA